MNKDTSSSPALVALAEQLRDVRTLDRHGLQRRWQALQRRAQARQPIERGLAGLRREVTVSLEAVARRRANLPRLEYPPELPVSAHREEIIALIRQHQVVVISGATGSGKTTQLPKLALEAGQGVRGLIGHTQPRRLAARTVAARIAQELGEPLGQSVGYQVRFDEKLGPAPYLKLMTDGILLVQTQSDRWLNAYDTLIIDEAHERSLNIDFLLGYLKQLLPGRPDLKLIITSATIDPQRFSRHFGDAPMLEVSGRTYPVELRYRPLRNEVSGQELDLTDGIVHAVEELDRAGRGDILVFLPGEQDIRETAEAMRKAQLRHTDILPLYARLGARAQNLVFQPHQARRIVLATNVAETSLTVPGIRYVIDSGLARISRYSYRTKVSRLPIEPISQASADQRAGRCGRTAPGICVRLYAEEDYQARPRFTEPEIQRTNLASVILQMKDLGLGDLQRFPFIDPPDSRYVNDGVRLLQELGALDEEEALTRLGRDLARLPLDPRYGRILLAGAKQHCLHEILIIVAGLSIQDPRERPIEQAQAADEKHKPFRDEQSDFLSYLKLWQWYREQTGSQRRLRELCASHFLSYLRMHEWQDVHRELLGLVHELGLRINQQPADYAAVHRALLSGFLGQIGLKQETGNYAGPRGVRFHMHPGSTLFKKQPKWVMTAEWIETTRLYGRIAAGIDPLWVEQAARRLLKHAYFEPHWEKKPAQVAAYEQTSLYGLVLSPRRKINYGPIDPGLSREIFIRSALVEGDYDSRGGFLRHNLKLLESLREEEAKVRRPGVLIDEVALFQFYAVRIPQDIYSGSAFERWREQAERMQPRLLYLTREDLLKDEAVLGAQAAYPPTLEVAGLRLPLSYHFAPGDDADGVTVTVPLAMLAQLPPEPFEWLVPGLLEEKVTELIRGLPKSVRRDFVPAPQFARAVVEALGTQPRELGLLPAVTGELKRMTGAEVAIEDWALDKLPAHLRMRFAIINERGRQVAVGRDLAQLKAELAGEAKSAFSGMVASTREASPWERDDLQDWDFDELPEQVEIDRGGIRIRAYPSLSVHEGRLALRLFDTAQAAQAQLRLGLRCLIGRQLAQNIRYLEKNLPSEREMCLHYAPIGKCADLKQDIIEAVLARCLLEEPLPRTLAAYQQRLAQGRGQLMSAVQQLAAGVAPALAEYHVLRGLLARPLGPAMQAAMQDVRVQVARLIYPGFVAATPAQWLARLPVYLKAARLRLEKLSGRVARDQENQRIITRWQQYYERAGGDAQAVHDARISQLRWLIEEYRVSLFAQELGTISRISDKRLQELVDS